MRSHLKHLLKTEFAPYVEWSYEGTEKGWSMTKSVFFGHKLVYTSVSKLYKIQFDDRRNNSPFERGMPITCPIVFVPMDTEYFGELDYSVMRHAFACQNDSGRLADEIIYHNDFVERLRRAGFIVFSEVPVTASFGSFRKPYSLDVVVENRAVYELKTVARLSSGHSMQLMNYLLMLDLQRGKLINFRSPSIESKFVNAPFSVAERRRFSVNKDSWNGPTSLIDFVEALVEDWGTGLEMALYHQAIVHFLGGDWSVNALLPLNRNGNAVGNQRFHLISDNSAFRVTTFNNTNESYASNLEKLLHMSPLRAFHWVNIAYHELTFTTVTA